MTPKQQFIDAYNEEHAKTLRVLRSLPPDLSHIITMFDQGRDLRPSFT